MADFNFPDVLPDVHETGSNTSEQPPSPFPMELKPATQALAANFAPPLVPNLPPAEPSPTPRMSPPLQQMTCPFAALSHVLEAGGTINAPGRKKAAGNPLPTIGQDEMFAEEPSSTGMKPVLQNGNLNLTCPMTGNAINFKNNLQNVMEAAEKSASSQLQPLPTELARQGSQNSALSGASAGGKRGGGSKSGSRAGQSRMGKSATGKSSRSSQRKGGGGVMGQQVSRRDRGVSRRKAPEYNQADVDKYAPLVQKSWARALELKGYFELGNLYYDTLFEEAQELAPLFTLERERMGVKFVDMLGAMTSVVESPPKMHEKLESLAPMHIQRGVRSTDMPSMGKVLFSVLTQGLGAEFTEEVQEAWGWVWAWLTKSMTLTLESATGHSCLVITSWDICLDNYTEEDLGGMLFDTLFEVAPSLKSMFARPRPVMAMKFVEMVSTLVSFSDDEARMIEQITWLGSRHVKYGARPHHIPIMGQVLLTVLEQACGDEWTDAMATAWSDLWRASCDRMMLAIKGGEQYGHVIESLWEKVSKKADSKLLGLAIVRNLSRSQPDLVRIFTANRAELAKQEKAKAMEDWEENKKKKMAEKNAKATAANSLVISTDAPKPIDVAGVIGESNMLKRLKSMLSRRKKPMLAMSQREEKEEMDVEKGEGGGKCKDGCKTPKAAAAASSMPENEDAINIFGSCMSSTLHEVMSLLWEPEQMNERLIVTGTRWFNCGLRIEHLDDVGKAIHTSLRVALEAPCAECGNHEWDDEISGAWDWIWNMMCTSLKKTIGSLEADHMRVLRENWEYMKSIKTPEEIGDAFYSELGREAPFVLHLFQRPKKLQSYMWMQALELLVVFSEVPARFFEELRHLTIRHIKYGVKAEYIKPFGKAVLSGLEELMGSKWDEVNKAAWKMLWQRVSTCVTRSLNVGTNLITVSLVNGDLERLQDAIMCAPRADRVSWVCRVEVYGSILSPIYWAIRDGKIEIAEFLISDALCINADRDNYYYGRAELHETHPDMLAIFCRDCPALVDPLFDGLLWYSQTVDDGLLRANYYIADLFSNPKEVPDAWDSPLAITCLEGQPSMFGHPCMEKLLELKWSRYGKNVFIFTQAWFVLLLAVYSAAFLDAEPSKSQISIILQAFTGVMALITLVFITVLLIRQMFLGHCIQFNLRWFFVKVPRLLLNPWQFARYVSVILIVANVVTTPMLALLPETKNTDVFTDSTRAYSSAVLKSITSLLLFMQLLQIMVISTKLSALSYTIGQLFFDVARTLTIVGVVLISFAAALTGLNAEGYGTFQDSAWILLKYTLMMEHPPVDNLGIFGGILVVSYFVIAGLGLLSILIAQLTLAFNTLSTKTDGFAKMKRAYVCVESESLMTLTRRQKVFDEMGFDLPLEFDNGDQGPAGGVQVKESARIRAHEKYVPDRIRRSTGISSPAEPWPRMMVDENPKSEHEQ